jgi:hypothetical protein
MSRPKTISHALGKVVLGSVRDFARKEWPFGQFG